jgi:hypothetical protein
MSDSNIPVTANGSVHIDCDNNNNGSSEKIIFSHDNGTELMRIQENGSVGIGTSNPSYDLHVEGGGARIVCKGNSAYTYTTINAINSDSDNLEMLAYGRNATGTYLGQTRGGGLFIGAQPNAVFALGTTNAKPLVLGTDNTERMRITSNGNIGIGTSSPSAYADITLQRGVLCIKETTTPGPDTGHGKIYTKTNNRLYFQDGAGTEHEIAFT